VCRYLLVWTPLQPSVVHGPPQLKDESRRERSSCKKGPRSSTRMQFFKGGVVPKLLGGMGRADFLARRIANHTPLTPLTFLERAR
jgi:hypothetical protein